MKKLILATVMFAGIATMSAQKTPNPEAVKVEDISRQAKPVVDKKAETAKQDVKAKAATAGTKIEGTKKETEKTVKEVKQSTGM